MGNPVTTESASHNDGLSDVGCIPKRDRQAKGGTNAYLLGIRDPA